MTNDINDVLKRMETYGGSFVYGLASLYRRGDPMNQQRLEGAFPEYFKQYDDEVTAEKERKS